MLNNDLVDCFTHYQIILAANKNSVDEGYIVSEWE